MPHRHNDIIMPQPAKNADTLTRHFCALFHHQFHATRENDDALRIHTAICKTAALSGDKPEKVAGALVESGLVADRKSFPENFVAVLEESKKRPGWNINAMTESQRNLMTFWQKSPVSGYRRARRYLA